MTPLYCTNPWSQEADYNQKQPQKYTSPLTYNGYMNWFYVIIASIVEGITEFVPISSTGHLIILNHFLQIKDSPLISSFDIFIQLGAILAVFNLYHQELLKDKRQIVNLIASFIPTAIVGLVFYPFIKSYLFGNITITALNLFFGGLFIFILPKNKELKTPLTIFNYFKIGLFQSLSVIPGTSRALMSIAGGLYSGLSFTESLKYSFLLAIPTIGAATALDLYKNRTLLVENPQNLVYFVVGFLLSFITAKFTLQFFLKTTKEKGLAPYGYYRLLLATSLVLISVFS